MAAIDVVEAALFVCEAQKADVLEYLLMPPSQWSA